MITNEHGSAAVEPGVVPPPTEQVLSRHAEDHRVTSPTGSAQAAGRLSAELAGVEVVEMPKTRPGVIIFAEGEPFVREEIRKAQAAVAALAPGEQLAQIAVAAEIRYQVESMNDSFNFLVEQGRLGKP